jgi:hypothetical protein
LAERHRLNEITHKVLLTIRSSIWHELVRSEDYRDKLHIRWKIDSILFSTLFYDLFDENEWLIERKNQKTNSRIPFADLQKISIEKFLILHPSLKPSHYGVKGLLYDNESKFVIKKIKMSYLESNLSSIMEKMVKQINRLLIYFYFNFIHSDLTVSFLLDKSILNQYHSHLYLKN